MNRRVNPTVSVGLPVFNGENFLAEAVNSVLAQTYTDFELIICDNASTDRTEQICRSFAEADSRIRYYRSETNIGSAPNFNLTFHHASARYFKWLSHDDVMAPEYLAATIAVLESNPDAALCHSVVKLINPNGDTLDIHDTKLPGAGSARPQDRFRALALLPHQCLDLDGLARSDALALTAGLPSYPACDRALLAEIGLQGRILRVPEPLLMAREHPDRFRRAVSRPEDCIAFYDTSNTGVKMVPTWRLYADYWRMVRRHVPNGRDRLGCYGHLFRWWFVNWNSARLAVDLLALVAPGILGWSEKFKQKMISPEPGLDAQAHKGS